MPPVEQPVKIIAMANDASAMRKEKTSPGTENLQKRKRVGATRFLGSLLDFTIAHRDHELRRARSADGHVRESGRELPKRFVH